MPGCTRAALFTKTTFWAMMTASWLRYVVQMWRLRFVSGARLWVDKACAGLNQHTQQLWGKEQRRGRHIWLQLPEPSLLCRNGLIVVGRRW